jgi:hypothetical protein
MEIEYIDALVTNLTNIDNRIDALRTICQLNEVNRKYFELNFSNNENKNRTKQEFKKKLA